ncbi:DDE-type integrase/transposase/recombinase [Erysipelothrix sp. HDW6A]|uniref:DDE-type integrase/transposase/recombinase n=1 Tax=Erysipelothrix sp. HDW6A TaxID=2714928 RepID=UPI00140BFF9E|nr:DDE-type integrase/transposase/recombinase [Erysipelothrix sp. HDW6A]QIK57046.1 DDE-type integrase/transposase/recombinase [Erysipelothrix sp. HDW6A]
MPLARMSTVKPLFKASKHNNDKECINVLNQEFSPSEPNKVWVSDFRYIKTSKGFRYLCVIMVLFSRKISTWKLSNRMNSTLILDVFYDAFNVRKPQGNLLFHSDRGSQYRSFRVRKVMG